MEYALGRGRAYQLVKKPLQRREQLLDSCLDRRH
jgi:hypothetical protein